VDDDDDDDDDNNNNNNKTRKTLNRGSEKREEKRGLKDSEKILEIILKLFAEFRRNFPYVAD